MRKHRGKGYALLIFSFCISLISGVEARLQEKKPPRPSQGSSQQKYKTCKETGKPGHVNLILINANNSKINVIKIIREVTGLSLKQAKDLVESAPKPVKTNITREEAVPICRRLIDVGASASVEPVGH